MPRKGVYRAGKVLRKIGPWPKRCESKARRRMRDPLAARRAQKFDHYVYMVIAWADLIKIAPVF
jgi:hypothetical protein